MMIAQVVRALDNNNEFQENVNNLLVIGVRNIIFIIC